MPYHLQAAQVRKHHQGAQRSPSTRSVPAQAIATQALHHRLGKPQCRRKGPSLVPLVLPQNVPIARSQHVERPTQSLVYHLLGLVTFRKFFAEEMEAGKP